MSLYVTYKDIAISKQNPAICIPISMFSFIGFLLIASIIYITIFPPSSGGNGNRFVTPSDSEIKAIMYIYSIIPLVFDTTCDIPNWPH